MDRLQALSDLEKKAKRAHLDLVKESLATQEEIIDVKKLLLEENKAVVKVMEAMLEKEEAGETEEVSIAIKDRSE